MIGWEATVPGHASFHIHKNETLCWIKISQYRQIELPEWRFLWSSPVSESLIRKSRDLQNKTFVWWARSGKPYKMWDENAIGWRRCNITSQERKDYMEIEIVPFERPLSHYYPASNSTSWRTNTGQSNSPCRRLHPCKVWSNTVKFWRSPEYEKMKDGWRK